MAEIVTNAERPLAGSQIVNLNTTTLYNVQYSHEAQLAKNLSHVCKRIKTDLEQTQRYVSLRSGQTRRRQSALVKSGDKDRKASAQFSSILATAAVVVGSYVLFNAASRTL